MENKPLKTLTFSEFFFLMAFKTRPYIKYLSFNYVIITQHFFFHWSLKKMSLVKIILNHHIDAKLVIGSHINMSVLIESIPVLCRDPLLSFAIQLRQFPIKDHFWLTANKTHGSASKDDFFLHSQLYVAMERVRNSEKLKTLKLTEKKIHVDAISKMIYFLIEISHR